MGILRKFQQILPRSTLFTISKTFTRSRLDYADIFMTKFIILLFMINLNLFSIMHAWQ